MLIVFVRPSPSLSLPLVPLSEAAAGRLEASLESAFGPGTPREFYLTATEEEIASYLALRIPESPVSKPVVKLSPGRIAFQGVLNYPARFDLAFASTVTLVDGWPVVNIESLIAGPVALPTGMLASVTSTLNEMIVEAGLDLTFTELEVTTGRITVAGRKGDSWSYGTPFDSGSAIASPTRP